jgi:hypothetical protein
MASVDHGGSEGAGTSLPPPNPPSSSHPRHHTPHVVLGWGGVGIRGLAFVGVGVFLTLTVLDATQGPPDLGKVLGDCALFGVCLGFMLSMLMTRVAGDASSLILVGLFTITRIPAQDILRIDRVNGMQVVTTTGRRYGHIGYGQSLMAQFTGNRRGKRVATAIDGWLDTQKQSSSGLDDVHPTRRLRIATLICFLGGPLITVPLALVLRR